MRGVKPVEERHFSGIRFDWLFFRELRFVDNLERLEQAQLEELRLDLDLSTHVSEDGHQCKLLMTLVVSPPEGDEDLFQRMSATLEAGFSVSEEEGEPAVPLQKFVRRQGPAILMPYLREKISDITSDTRFGQVLLPPINVAKVMEEMEKAAKEAEQQEAGSEPEPQGEASSD